MELVMNYNQYLQWKNKEKTELDIKLENSNLKILNNRKMRKKFERQAVIGMATALFILSNPVRVMAVDLSSMQKLGNTIVTLIQKAGYWLILAMALLDIIKTSMKSGNNASEIGKLILYYLLIFASLHFMPYLFNMVAEAF